MLAPPFLFGSPRLLKIVYIMGAGRSGSTALDLVLGSARGALGTGELWAALEEDSSKTGSCACGEDFDECKFWTAALDRYENRLRPRGLSDVRRLRRLHDQARRLPQKLLGREPEHLEQYRADTIALFESLAEESNASTIVDSTKQVGRGFNLAQCPGLDVYVIHLIRDGRGVMWSRLRDRLRGEVYRNQWLRDRPGFSIAKWTAQNALAERVGLRLGQRYRLLRYEDFASEPISTLREIAAWASLDLDDVIEALNAGEPLTASHQIGGNVRARSSKRTFRVNADESWKREMPRGTRAYFWLAAGWYARRFGYSRSLEETERAA